MQWGHAKIIKSENESQRSTDDMTTLSEEIQGREIVTPFTVMKREKTTKSKADRQAISTCANGSEDGDGRILSRLALRPLANIGPR